MCVVAHLRRVCPSAYIWVSALDTTVPEGRARWSINATMGIITNRVARHRSCVNELRISMAALVKSKIMWL